MGFNLNFLGIRGKSMAAKIIGNCKRKIGYETEVAAKAAIIKSDRHGQAYPCDLCGKWHWGHYEPKNEGMQ